MNQTKYIFVTGGVTSSLGKGIIAASLAKLLQGRGYRTTIQKFDPYINVDPGTLKNNIPNQIKNSKKNLLLYRFFYLCLVYKNITIFKN